MERKSGSSKGRSSGVARPVDLPRSNGTLVVVGSLPTASSTPSSPNRNGGIRRNRSHSSDARWPTEKTANSDDDVNNDVNNDDGGDGGGGGETAVFSLAELTLHHCDTVEQRQHNQAPYDHLDDVTELCDSESTADRPTSGSSSKAPLEVEPPSVEQPLQKAASIDESPLASRKSDGSCAAEQPRQRAYSGTVTRTKTTPSEAITDITQAKKFSHRAVVARLRKTPDESKAKDLKQRQSSVDPASKAAAGVKMERGRSAKGSRGKVEDKKQEHNGTAARSEKTASTAGGDSNELATRQLAGPATQSTAESEAKVVGRNKATTAPASSDKQKSAAAASTTSKKNVREKAKPPPPPVPDDDDDEDDEFDWMNMITSLRDPDDIRHRQSVPRRGSSTNVLGQKLPAKQTKEEKTEEEEDDEEVTNVCRA